MRRVCLVAVSGGGSSSGPGPITPTRPHPDRGRGGVRRPGRPAGPWTRLDPARTPGRSRAGTRYPPVHRRGARREPADDAGLPRRRLRGDARVRLRRRRSRVRHRPDGGVPRGADLPRTARRGTVHRPPAGAALGRRDRRLRRTDQDRPRGPGQPAARELRRSRVPGERGIPVGARRAGVPDGDRHPRPGRSRRRGGARAAGRRGGQELPGEGGARARGAQRGLRRRRCRRRPAGGARMRSADWWRWPGLRECGCSARTAWAWPTPTRPSG